MKDSIVEQVRQDLLDRSNVGIKKYGTTLDRKDLGLKDFINHAREEAMDLSLYLTRASNDIQEISDSVDVMSDEFHKLEALYMKLNEANDELSHEVFLKNKIITNLNKVILSQEEEIKELKKDNHLQQKRRAWHI